MQWMAGNCGFPYTQKPQGMEEREERSLNTENPLTQKTDIGLFLKLDYS